MTRHRLSQTTSLSSELRKDYIQDKYVIIAPHRGARPRDFKPERVQTRKNVSCVFCPQNINHQTALLTIGKSDWWEIKVIPNKFPAVSFDNPKAYGTQEVIIETPDHHQAFENLSVARIAKLLEVYAVRTRAISENPQIDYLLIFKNTGGRAGASLHHAHSQIFATSFLPAHLFDKSQKVQAYKLRNGTCVYCDVIQEERRGPRFVWEDKHTIAFTPYASMHNYEIWIVPKRHLDNITLLSAVERRSFAQILKKVIKRIDELGLSYNYYFHQVIHDEDQHLYLKLTPRGTFWAGVEIGSGIIINPISPEDAATFYRDGLPS
jgi:UDPglucose--hexose-1-phosphate uridylyltransferase